MVLLAALEYGRQSLRADPAKIEADSEAAASDHPLQLVQEERRIVIERANIRWLWWPLILYFFWGMAYICDEYFVRTIEVISERFQIPDDVAGATLMALGCNGPEMALNTIAIFQPSDIGVGAVVGGEVFNVLVITGAALLATPAEYMPLRIGKFSFFRDVIFYIASLVLLRNILRDGKISRMEPIYLLLGAVAYSTVVSTSNFWRHKIYSWKRQVGHKLGSKTMSFGKLVPSENSGNVSDEPDSDLTGEVSEQRVTEWEAAKSCADPCKGTVLDVRVETHNRLLNRMARTEERYMWLTQDALVVSTVPDPQLDQKHGRHTSEMVSYHFKGQRSRYMAGGLVNKATMFFDDHDCAILPEKSRPDIEASAQDSLYAPLLSMMNHTTSALAKGGPADALGVFSNPFEEIPFRDILYCDPVETMKTCFVLHVHRHEGLDQNLGQLVTIQLKSASEEVTAAWVEQLGSAITHTQRGSGDHAPSTTVCSKFSEVVEWFQFPVKFAARLTIPDMDDPELHKYWPFAFCTNMMWLAVFAFCVVSACDWIHEDFGISTGVLGFTVAAAGTSFPNVFSGMVVSRQGKTTMALANALGANIQNVFLALAVPWFIQSNLSPDGTFEMKVEGLDSAILECLITLAPCVLVFFCCGFTMPRWSGALYLFTYCAYLVLAIGQEGSGCEVWPLTCPDRHPDPI